MAWKATKNGAKTTVIIGVNALKIITKGGWQQKFKPEKLTIRSILKNMIKDGVKILVCSMSVKTSGLTKSASILKAMLEKDTKTFEY